MKEHAKHPSPQGGRDPEPNRLIRRLLQSAAKMPNHRFFITALVLIVCLSLTAQQQPVPHPSIQGVWRVVEETTPWRTITNPRIGFIIYTAKHFALVREVQDIKRPDVRDVDHATAQQLLAVWAPFAAQFGTYEVKGDVLTLNILVAKNPSLMGTKQIQRFKVDGNTLTTEPFLDPGGMPLSKPVTLKLARVE